ncbi:sigma-54-dependent transcriptional regulator [Desulfoferrobacter suflitae]|uniref:sigma-54-dependent transcriptional regulator n=1 Tax=Desulfoferrobacter suflitae TaxID=2865782 RepID=UPI002164DC38|nr:sigma-54 dependent transcriptional regulator [Desulfoferrobacter suflitae]MCK8601335.1 sigma-54 dependent transcriptional regulator [Desulfoferrobacter suflitae]
MKQSSPHEGKRILIVDDDGGAREALELILEDHYEVETAEDGLRALHKIKNTQFELVLLDVNMPKITGIEVLKRIKKYDDSIDVVMVSAADRAREAADSIKCGAYDYITKPFDAEKITACVERVMAKRALELEACYSGSEMSCCFGDVEIVGRSKPMEQVFRLIDKVAKTSSSVLISGESGTGKELVARAIHARSERVEKPFVAINCAAIPQELIESELFGHEKGSFTGAHVRAIGKFEYADGGTLFLDEISSLNLPLQAKLLRVLQEREFTRVGSHRTISVDVRVIAATNMWLNELVKSGAFRGDLYFRLNVIPILLPPLREREGDVPLLCSYFLTKYDHLLNKKIKGIKANAMSLLQAYPWPGNVRELENMVERLVVLAGDGQLIDENDLPFGFLTSEDQAEWGISDRPWDTGLIEARQTFERHYIMRALQRCGWNQTDAARLLRIHRNTLLQKIKVLKIRPDEPSLL